MNIIKKLKSNEFAVIVAVLSVLVQSFHSYYAFYNVSSLKGTGWGVAQAVLFAIVFDMAILFYTVRNKKDVVLGAAFFLVLINAYYYYQHLGFTFEFIFGCFLSVIIPVTQYYYSEEIREEEERDEINPYHYARVIEDKDAEIDKAEARVAELETFNKKVVAEMGEASDHLARRLDDLARLQLDRDGILKKSETHRKDLVAMVANFDEAIRLRDTALNSNSVLSQALGIKEREIFELKKKLGEIPADAEINPRELEVEIRETLDRSLLNVQEHKDDAAKYEGYNPTSSNRPVPLPEE